ncbi:MAG: hypothetical protein KAG82_01855 [Alcanivoracaceae bacterium]|nr:hypothetical protein [Alcanivoracaceae bacterium]
MSNDSPQGNTIKIVYVLYLASLIFGITSLIGVIVAYVNQGQGNETESAHLRYQIRTFWIGFLYAVICGITSVVGIGLLLFVALLIWWIVRNVKGLMAINAGKAPDNVESWLI